jgi:DNA-directed RNA polymerase specialized sigma24 family protein
LASAKKTIREFNANGPRGALLDQGRRRQTTTVPVAARAQFIAASSGLLFGLLLLTLHDTGTAEEVLAQVCEDIKQEAEQFDPRRESLLVWLITLTHWRLLEQLRSGSEKRRDPDRTS